jgi:hypothetical protein
VIERAPDPLDVQGGPFDLADQTKPRLRTRLGACECLDHSSYRFGRLADHIDVFSDTNDRRIPEP